MIFTILNKMLASEEPVNSETLDKLRSQQLLLNLIFLVLQLKSYWNEDRFETNVKNIGWGYASGAVYEWKMFNWYSFGIYNNSDFGISVEQVNTILSISLSLVI